MERTIGKAVKQAVNGVPPGEPGEDQPMPSKSSDLPERCCGRCVHADRQVQVNHLSLTCQAHPPRIIAIPTQGPNGQAGVQLTSMYPPVDERGRCGEFVRKADG